MPNHALAADRKKPRPLKSGVSFGLHMKKSVILTILFFIIVPYSFCKENKVAELAMMTWFHPLLEPGLADITIKGTITNVEKREVYGNPYYDAEIKIEEIINLKKRFKKYIEGKTHIKAGDFNQRKFGEQVIVFAGGEPYHGIEFLCPSWDGTNCNFGIVLKPSGDLYADQNDQLLAALRERAKGKSLNSDFMEAFANFCPRGVAKHFIMLMRIDEMKKEGAKVGTDK